jgi:hypothetical protein
MTLLTHHSLLRLKKVTYVGSGTVSAGLGGSVSPGFPSGILSGDLIIVQSYHRSSGQTIPSAPLGYSQLYNDVDPGSFTRQYIFSRIANGTETGTLLLTNSGGSTLHMGKIHVFRGNKNSSFREGEGLHTVNSSTITHADIASRRGALAVCFIGYSDDAPTLGDMTGATNGTWVERTEDVSTDGDDGMVSLQTAMVQNTGTVSGGTYSISPSTKVYINRSFAIIPR